MIIDRIGNLIRLTLSARIQTADDPLEFRELAIHFRGEITLRQLGRAVRLGDAGLMHAQVKPLFREPASAIPDAFHLVPVAAKAGLVGDALQFGKIVGEPTFLVGLPEEAGIDRKSTRLNSSHEWISYAVFCLKKKKAK